MSSLEVSVQVFCPFFNWIVCLPGVELSFLYILEFKLLSGISMANRFSHTVGSLFIFLVFSLAVQKLFILMKTHLFILSFKFLALADISVKILLQEII